MHLPAILRTHGATLRRGLALQRAGQFWRRLSRVQKAVLSGASTGLVVLLVALLILLPAHPQQAFASGVYTSSSTDGDGNTQLASNTVNDTNYYDTSQDSSPDVQQQLGVDPNWKNGVVRESHGLGLNGSSQYVSVANSSSLAIGISNFTLEAWVKTTSASGAQMIADKANSKEYGFAMFNGVPGYTLNNGTTATYGGLGSTSIADGKWHDVAMVFTRNANVVGYVDGVSIGSAAISTMAGDLTNTGSMAIGRNAASSAQFFNGTIDELRVSSVARYTSSYAPSRRFTEDANTVSLWHFDEGTGTTVKDSSTNGNDGSLVNSPYWTSGSNAIQDGFVGCSPDATSPCSGTGGQTGAGNLTLASTSSTTSRKGYDVKTVPSSGLLFDGSNDYAALNGLTSLRSQSAITIEAWVKFSSFNSGIPIFTNSSDQGGNSSILLATGISGAFGSNSGLFARVGNGQNSFGYTSGSVLTANTWMHLAMVFDGSGSTNSDKLKIYLNGVALPLLFNATLPTLSANNSYIANFVLGSVPGSAPGVIDEVRISNTARYTSNFTPSRRFSTDANTLALYHLDEGTGTTTADASGNGNTGILMNGTSNSPAADGTTNGPLWTDGIQAQGQASSTSWAFPGYQFRTKLNVAAGSSALPAGYGVETTLNRGSILDNKQTRADGNDWRVAYQPAAQKTSLNFDGASSVVNIPYNPNLNVVGGNFSASAWIKPTSFAGVSPYINGIIGNYTSGSNGWTFRLVGNASNNLKLLDLGLGNSSSSANVDSSSFSISAGTWNHVGFSYVASSGLTTFYLNGKAIGTATTSHGIGANTNTYQIGTDYSARWFAGSIDDVRIYNSTLGGSTFSSQYNGGQGKAGVAGESGLIAGYHLDEGSGQSIVDYSGNQNNGYLGSTTGSDSADPTWTTTDGAVSTTQELPRMIPHGNALTFDGSNDFIDLGNTNDFNTGDTRTIEATFKTTTLSTRQVIIAKEQNTGPSYLGWDLEINNPYYGGAGTVMFYYNGSSGTVRYTTPANAIQANAWNHVAFIYVNKTVKMYINGVAAKLTNNGFGTFSNTPTSVHTNIGSLDGGQLPFSGQISAVRISTTARYNGNFTVTTAPWANDVSTVGLWRLGEGSGTTVADASSGSNTGTLMNGSSNSSAADGATNGPIWVKNGGYQDSMNQTDFTTVAPISASTTDGSYYVYYGNLGEKAVAQNLQLQSIFSNGSTSRIIVGASSSLNISSSITLSAWIKTSRNHQVVLGGYNNAGPPYAGYGLGIGMINSTGHISYLSQNGVWVEGASAVNDGSWHFISVTFSASTASFYKDGIADGTASALAPAAYSGNRVLAGTSDGTQAYLGSLDDIRIYSRALSSSEVSALYSNTPAVSNTGLAGWWKLDEGAGTTATDSSGSGNTGTLTNFGFDQNSGWLPNRNLLYASPDATVTAVNASTPEQESPVFYQWRQAGGTWSTRSQISATPQSLGSEGVQLSFNPEGAYSLNDYYGIESWAVEAPSTTSPQRGKRRSFPDRANIVASSGGVDILDASTNKLWMRLSSGTSTNLLGTNAPKKVAALNGHLYTASNDGLTDINLIQDKAARVTSAGTATYAGNLSQRVATLSYGTASGTTLPSTTVNDVAPVTSSGIQYVGVATSAGLSTLSSATGSPTSVTFANTASNAYSHVALASNGKLYGSNTTSSQLDRFDTPFTATTTVTGASASYSTSTTPALISNTINAISVSAGASISDNVSNEVALATSAGTDVLDENTTTASGQVRHYVKQGATGTSGYTEKQFGGGLSLNNTRYASIPAASSLSLSGSGTIEAWIKPTIGGTDILDKSTNNSNVNYRMYLGIQGNATDYHLGFYSSAGGAISTGTVTPNAWNHVAVTISSGTIYFSINGQVSNAASTSFGATNAGNISIGSRSTGGFSFQGQIDEVRISNSTRYTSNFTPSIKEFTRDANTAGLWHFDERSGQTVTDDSGNSNDGTLGATSSAASDDPLRVIPAIQGSTDTDTIVSLARSNDRGQGLGFNGTSNFVKGKLGSALTNNYTISTWVKPVFESSGNSGHQYVAIFGDSNPPSPCTGQSEELVFNGSVPGNPQAIALSRCNGYGALTGSVTGVSSGVWTFVSVTVTSGNVITYYINGVATSSFQDSTHNLSMGTTFTIGDNYTRAYSGSIDDTRIYNRALTSSEVATLYNGGQGRVDNPSSGLVAWYKLNDGGSQTVTDSSGSGNNGTLGANSSIASDDPTVATGSPVQDRGALWIGSNDGSAGGAVTSISLNTDRQVNAYQASTSALPSNNISSLATSSTGELALVGTDSGAWNPGTAGGFVDDSALIASEAGPARLKSGTVRLKGGTRLK